MHVTRHALDRFADRCLGMATPVHDAGRRVLSRMLVLSLGESVQSEKPKVWGTWPVCIEGDRIITVLPIGGRPMEPARLQRRRSGRP